METLCREAEADAGRCHAEGVLALQRGNPHGAVVLLRRAATLSPNLPDVHVNLAEAYRTDGQWELAADCCRTALRLDPECPEAYCVLGLALQGMGKSNEAIDQFRRALQIRPDFAACHSNLGVALRECKQEEALAHFRRAVEIEPAAHLAQSNLGQLLLDRGNAEEALAHCEAAVRLRPRLAPLHHNLGNVLRVLRRRDEARSAYLEAVRLDPGLTAACDALGNLYLDEGHLDNALHWFKQAADLQPENVEAWVTLADTFWKRRKHAEAVPCWQHVLTLDPERAVAHVSLGLALQAEGQRGEAREHFLTALLLQPDLAWAQVNLGVLHEEDGDIAEAETAYRAARRLHPAYANPHVRLANLLRGELPAADQQALEERLADPQLPDQGRCELLFALAHVLDGRGDYVTAAGVLRQANALKMTSRPAHERPYDPAALAQLVNGTIRTFRRGFFARRVEPESERKLIFIFGLPRSGTTLIEQVLASHGRVHGSGELGLGQQAFESLPASLGKNGPPLDCVPALDAVKIAAKQYAWLRSRTPTEAEYVTDKMPDNYLYLGLLAALFPRATFIHCRRDPRNVAVSCWMTNFYNIPWADDPKHIAWQFRHYRRLMDHWQDVLPVRIHHVDYEETVRDLEGVARRLFAACGLSWEPACLDFHRTRRPVRTASATQVRQPIYRRSVARWKHYETALGELFRELESV